VAPAWVAAGTRRSQRLAGQVLVFRHTSSVPPTGGAQPHAAALACRLEATSPEPVGPPAALLYATRTLLQITASAATGGGLASAAVIAVCRLVMSPCKLDEPVPEFTAASARSSALTSPHTFAAWTTAWPLYHRCIAADCAAVSLPAAGRLGFGAALCVAAAEGSGVAEGCTVAAGFVAVLAAGAVQAVTLSTKAVAPVAKAAVALMSREPSARRGRQPRDVPG
jgi:hypothetical protein